MGITVALPVVGGHSKNTSIVLYTGKPPDLFKVVILNISVLVDLQTPVLTHGTRKCSLILELTLLEQLLCRL